MSEPNPSPAGRDSAEPHSERSEASAASISAGAKRRWEFKRVALLTVVVLFLGWQAANYLVTETRERVVAVGWGDSRYGKSIYKALVFLEPVGNAFVVKARVEIAGPNYWHDCGELGRPTNAVEAAANWGQIQFLPDGLHIGTGTNAYFLPRAKLESHR